MLQSFFNITTHLTHDNLTVGAYCNGYCATSKCEGKINIWCLDSYKR